MILGSCEVLTAVYGVCVKAIKSATVSPLFISSSPSPPLCVVRPNSAAWSQRMHFFPPILTQQWNGVFSLLMVTMLPLKFVQLECGVPDKDWRACYCWFAYFLCSRDFI